MRHLALCSGIALSLSFPISAMAEDAAQLKVTGTISPASCGVSVTGGTAVQLGTVKLSDFTPGEDLALAEKTASLTINCEGAAATFRLIASDATSQFADTTARYGLGYNEQGGGAAKSNGYFNLSIDAASMSTNNFVMKSTDAGGGGAWTHVGSENVPFSHDGEAFAFAASADAEGPASLVSLTVPLKINAVLTRDPVVNDDVALAGQATIEIKY